MKPKYFIPILLVIFCACNSPKNNTQINQETMAITISKNTTVDELATELISNIKTKGFKVIADINHATGAAKANMQLRPTRTLIFGNPLGGTKLMQQDQAIGLDLPLKILIWEDKNGQSNLSYFNGSALTSRYNITEPQAVIKKINDALAGFTGGTSTVGSTKSVKNKLVSKKSNYNVDSTFTRLKNIVLSKGLTIMAEVPHDRAAASVGLELRPTRTLIFGNPKIGTFLMQSNQEIGLDLPLKILVYENEAGDIFMSYFDASFLANRYGITDKTEVVSKINGALNSITDAVISE